MSEFSCFKAYDLRGRIPDELNVDIAYRVGRAFIKFSQAKKLVVGHDIRLSSPDICDALVRGLRDQGADIYHIGECGTEEIYFSTAHFDMDGGIMVTASHNPKNYNGMKFVREEAKPISRDSGLREIERLVGQNNFRKEGSRGSINDLDHRAAYIKRILRYIEPAKIAPLRIVVNAGNGGAGAVIDRIEEFLPCEFIKIHHKPDGSFPNGVPNPLLIENRLPTADAIKKYKADLGLAWDGDFDRCFFFDSDGRFIEGYYIIGLLAQSFLERKSDNRVVHDPRLIWNTKNVVESLGGIAIQSKAGHSFIKERMRIERAIYGGEMSAHHYFQDFFYSDSGMIPWLLVISLMSNKGKSLAELVNEGMRLYPVSGEINCHVDDAPLIIRSLEDTYSHQAKDLDYTDGLSISFDEWRFNVRMSNTEPVIRINVESRGDEPLMRAKTKELHSLIQSNR
ncbi:MAG: phosphomannomutase [Candidatus Azotimanducaceae bacterium]|nr:phosphomannomutase [Gammaproteobacteria bacterium]